MDFRLKVSFRAFARLTNAGFNPCSNGLSAQSNGFCNDATKRNKVSILVLMDFRLKATFLFGLMRTFCCFNPCSNGLSAQRGSAVDVLFDALEFQSLF